MDETINLRLIGKRMKEAREKRHLTQAEVAEALSIHTNSYGNYERGTERPSLIKIVQSCIVLGIQPGDLLNECVPGLQLQSLANIELERPELLELIIRAMPEDAFCECRLSRNLASARVMMEDSDLCTRLYPFGSGEGTDRISLTTLTGQQYVDAETIDTWGVVSKTFTEEDIYDALTLQEVANRYLDRHKNPTLSVELDAFDLYAATGQALDHFRLGRMCRLPLPQYGTTMYERVICKAYPDVYNNPEAVTVTLANKMKTVSDEIAELTREATRSKLLGGTVESEEITSSYPSISVEEPYGQTFQISGYGNVLAVKLIYACAASGTTLKVQCRVTVDGNSVPESEDKDGTVDILRYLKTDENGVPTEGDHTIGLSPIANTGVSHYINTRIIIKTIKK